VRTPQNDAIGNNEMTIDNTTRRPFAQEDNDDEIRAYDCAIRDFMFNAITKNDRRRIDQRIQFLRRGRELAEMMTKDIAAPSK
jgi:hypothetical protein